MRNCTRNIQKEQAAEKANKDALDSLMGDDLGKQHVNNCLKDDFYTENTSTCTSNIAPNRVLKYHWKGMNADQTNQIRLDQLRQIEDKKMRETTDKEEDKMWAEQEEANRINLIRIQREHDRAKNSRVLDEVVEYNRLKAKECERRDKIIYDHVHNYKVF
jgi:RIB43A